MSSRWTAVFLASQTTLAMKTTSLLISKSKTTVIVIRNLPVLRRHRYEPHRSKTVKNLFAKLTYRCCVPKLPQNKIESATSFPFKKFASYLFLNPSNFEVQRVPRVSFAVKVQIYNFNYQTQLQTSRLINILQQLLFRSAIL